MQLTRIEYTTYKGKPIIHLFTRDEEGNRIIKQVEDFRPYFYIPANEESRLANPELPNTHFTAEPKTLHGLFGEEIKKVFVDIPRDVRDLRGFFSKTWEADIRFPIRYMVDEIDTIEKSPLKVMTMDIEVTDISDIETAPAPIPALSFYINLSDSYTTFIFREDFENHEDYRQFDNCFWEVRFFSKEKDMLEAVVKFIRDESPDIMTNWNLVRFDYRYLIHRLERLNINPKRMSPLGTAYMEDARKGVLKGCALFDLYDAYKNMELQNEESYKLDYIANKVIGEGKTVSLESESGIINLWKNDSEKLLLYNVNDVRLVQLIDKKKGLISFFDEIRRIAHCQLEDTLYKSSIIDPFILHKFHNEKIFPSKVKHEKKSYEGAYVARWGVGIYDNVAVFDIKSLYPSSLVSANMSPETIVTDDNKECITIDTIRFSKTIKGFLPEVIRDLFVERTKFKDLMKACPKDSDEYTLNYNRQYAVKILLNSVYGQLAYINSRFYYPEIAAAITYLGREIIQWSKKVVEDLGTYQVLYCDTDSLFLNKNDGGVIENMEANTIRDIINSSYEKFSKQFNISTHIFDMEFEKIYKRAFFGTVKKRYAGLTEDGKIDITGFERKRSDSSPVAKKLQMRLFQLLLISDIGKEGVKHYLKTEMSKIKDGKYGFNDLGIPRGISKGFDQYVTKPAHIRGAIYANENFEASLGAGSKPKMIYVSHMPKGYPGTDIICFDALTKLPEGIEINIDKMTELTVTKKAEGIFEALDWDVRELSGKYQLKLM